MAVVQDDAAAAAVELEPGGAAFVPLEALPAGRGRAARAGSVAAGLRECGVRQARRPPAVVCHPVRDRVCGARRGARAPTPRSGRIRASAPPLICSTGISRQGCGARVTSCPRAEVPRTETQAQTLVIPSTRSSTWLRSAQISST